MSRLYFHAKDRTAELHGSEYHHLRRIAEGPAEAAWGLNQPGAAFDRAREIMPMVARDTSDRWLLDEFSKAEEADRRGDYEPGRRFVMALATTLRVNGLDLDVAGVRLRTANLDANTALVAGSDVVRVATKLGQWGGQHCWVEGSDRKWLADIIDEGLRTGIYRRNFWYVDRPCDGPVSEQPDRKVSVQGWDDVLALLRESDDGPVVLSYSVDDGFPNREVADWAPPALPEDWAPSWADGDQGRADWDAMDEDTKADYRDEQAGEAWHALPDAEQWDLAVAGLRERRPWARLGPDTLAEYWFGPVTVTVYDLFAPDRDERIRAAMAAG